MCFNNGGNTPNCIVCKSLILEGGSKECLNCFEERQLRYMDACDECNKPVMIRMVCYYRIKGLLEKRNLCNKCYYHKAKTLKSFQNEQQHDIHTKRELQFRSNVYWEHRVKGSTTMPRVEIKKKVFNPYWAVPKGTEGNGAWIIGKIAPGGVTSYKKMKSDKVTQYDTKAFELETNVELDDGSNTGTGKLKPITFKVEDAALGETIEDLYPRVPVPGRMSIIKEVGKYVAIIYMGVDAKGYNMKEMFVDETLEGLLSDLNKEVKPNYIVNVWDGFPGWDRVDAWHSRLATDMAIYFDKYGGGKDEIPF